MNIAAGRELALEPLAGAQRDGYGKRYYSKKYSYGYTPKKS